MIHWTTLKYLSTFFVRCPRYLCIIVHPKQANLLVYETRLSAIRDARQSAEKELAKQLDAKLGEHVDSIERSVVAIVADRDVHVQHNSALRHVAVEFCADVDDDECLMDAFSLLVHPQKVDQEWRAWR